jgi:hypothetical protein
MEMAGIVEMNFLPGRMPGVVQSLEAQPGRWVGRPASSIIEKTL